MNSVRSSVLSACSSLSKVFALDSLWRINCHRVAVLDEDHIHQEPGHAPVAVVEGMDTYEAIVEGGGDDYRVFAFTLSWFDTSQ